MKRYVVLALLMSIFTDQVMAQNTVGLLSYEPAASFDGFNLIYPHNQPNVYLLDACGQVVHIWEDEPDTRPGNVAYLRPDGALVKAKRPASFNDDPIWAPGGGATVEVRDWDNNLRWSFTLNDSTARLHHDIEPMPNGNILMISWERKNRSEAIAAGRDSTTLGQGALWPDMVIEVDPVTDSIVWEWHAWDHLVQDFDSTAANFGVVADHPERINVNFDTDDNPDWLHANAIDYHEGLDQILLCVPFLNEFWIIDHSTTTEQAASTFGGLAGKGGDLLYRWGNPQSYNSGVPEDQLLFNPHDAHWIEEFLDLSFPDYGKIIVFNNQIGPDFSQVNIVDPPWDMYSWIYTFDAIWGPANYDRTIAHPQATKLFSSGLSSAQVLPNGNYFICSGRNGYSFEITPSDEIVWEYVTPLRTGAPVTQGDTLMINNNLTFRNFRYPKDYPAFENRNFLSDTWIELEPDSAFCDVLSPVIESNLASVKVFPNPGDEMVVVEWQANLARSLEVFDLMGRSVFQDNVAGGRKFIDTSLWSNGIYYIRIAHHQVHKIIVKH